MKMKYNNPKKSNPSNLVNKLGVMYEIINERGQNDVYAFNLNLSCLNQVIDEEVNYFKNSLDARIQYQMVLYSQIEKGIVEDEYFFKLMVHYLSTFDSVKTSLTALKNQSVGICITLNQKNKENPVLFETDYFMWDQLRKRILT